MPTEKMNILVTFKNAAKAGAKGLTKDLNKISTSSRKASAGMKGMYTQLAGIGALLAGGALFGGAIKTFANFDDQMRAAGAVTGAMTDATADLTTEMKEMTRVAKDLGRTTRYTASQAAEALRFLGMAGFSAAEATKALPGTLQLAAAGALDLGTAADITTNVLTGFGIEVERLADVNDVLVKTFTSSNVNLIEIGEAFKFVGPIAKGVGSDFEDLVGAIGSLGNAGLKGTIAGTALKGAISALMAPTAQEAALMNGLKERLGGVSLQVRDTEGDFIGFRKIIEQLETAGIDGSEALELFGLRAGPGMAALINQGSEALISMVDKLKDAGYTAQQIATIMESGIGGELRRTISVFESFKIGLGEAFGPETIKLLKSFQLTIMKMEVAIKNMKEEGDFDGWGEAVIRVLDGIGWAIKKTIEAFNALAHLGNVILAALAGSFQDVIEQLELYGKAVDKFLGINQEETLVLTFKIDQEQRKKVQEDAKRTFEAIGKGAEATGKKVGETLFPKVSTMVNLKAILIRTRAILDSEEALTEKHYSQGLLTLDQFYATRLGIIQRAAAAERAIIARKLYVESDVDKKAILNAQLYALDQGLVADTLRLESEKFDEQEKLDRDRIKAVTNLNNLKLKAEKAYQDQKTRLVITDDALSGEFLKETADLQQRQNNELELIKSYHQAIVEDLIKTKATELEIEQAHADKVAAIQEQKALQVQEQDKLAVDQEIRLNKYKLDNFVSIAGGSADALMQLYELSGKKSKELFILSKAASLAEATMKVAQGVAGALGSPPYSTGAIANAAFIGALGAVQIASIASTNLAEGGSVPGKSPHSKADNIPAMLTAEEFVQPVASVKHYGKEIMEGLRTRSIPKKLFAGYAYGGSVRADRSHFANGGLVTTSKSNSKSIQVDMKNTFTGVDQNTAKQLSQDFENIVIKTLQKVM